MVEKKTLVGFLGNIYNNKYQNIQNPYEIDNPYGGKEDISWILR